MSATTISRIIACVSRQSSTGNAAARLDRCPALRTSLCALLKYCVSTARPKPTSQSGALDYPTPAPQRPLSNRRATLKSP
jgi:hypothetical protein